MLEELVEYRQLLLVVACPHSIDTVTDHQDFVAVEGLLHLHRVVGHQLGGGIDGRQAPADDAGGQAHLQVGHGGLLGGAGQLQRHQEIRCLADATNKVVLHVDDGRFAGARGDGNVIEAQAPGILDGQRPAEAHAAVEFEVAAPRQGQIDDLEEVLVPAHGDAVFGDAAEAGHDALVQIFVDGGKVAHYLRQVLRTTGELTGQGFDLEGVDADHRETFVQEIVRQGIARRSHAHHQHFFAVVRKCHRAFYVQRIPARQQEIHLEAEGHVQHIGQHIGFHLWNIHRRHLLIDAALHTVVADAMPGARAQRIVDHDERKGADIVAIAFQHMRFGDLFLQRATDERHPQRVDVQLTALVAHAFGAGVPIPIMAIDAVIDLVPDVALAVALIGKGEAIPASKILLARSQGAERAIGARIEMHQLREVRARQGTEYHPAFDPGRHGRVLDGRVGPALHVTQKMGDEFLRVLDGPGVGECTRCLGVYPQVLAQLLHLGVGVLYIAGLSLGELLVVFGKSAESRCHHAGGALVVPVLGAFGGGGALEQLHVAVQLVQVPVARVLALELPRRLVDHGALVSEKRGIVVAGSLHDRPALIRYTEQCGDESTQVGCQRHQQLRDRHVIQVRTLALAVIGVGLEQRLVGTAQARVENVQQLLQSFGAEQIPVAKPLYAKGKIP